MNRLLPFRLSKKYLLSVASLLIALVFFGIAAFITSTKATAAPAFSHYLNPLRGDGKHYAVGRIDQGEDYKFYGSEPQPVYAIGDGRIEGTRIGNAGWPNHVFIRYQLKTGQARGIFIYVAEDCTPNRHLSFHDGTPVTSSTILCYAFSGQDGIEMGFAQDPDSVGGEDIAMAYYEYNGQPDGTPTNFGLLFSHFMGALGGREGKLYKSTGQGSVILHSTPIPPIWSPDLHALIDKKENS